MKLKQWMAWGCLLGALLPAQASVSGVVISQVYGGGGNATAPLRNDFVEIFNASGAAVSLANWSIQYTSATGNSWGSQKVPLSGSIGAGEYRLVQLGSGGSNGVLLPTADFTGTFNMSATNGKVALVSSDTALTGACPTGATVVDMVGFGTGTCFETTAAAAPSATTALLRAADGCTDGNNNATDFATGAPIPRNAATAPRSCGVVLAQPIVPSCPAISLAAGSTGLATVTATDSDSIVNGLTLASGSPLAATISPFTAATVDGGTATGTVNIPAASVGVYSLPLQWSNDDGQTASCNLQVTVTGLTSIAAIQGSGATSALVGQAVTTRGVVTLKTNNGYFLQDPVGDGNPLTSDGIFVFASPLTVQAGDLVEISATVAEFNVGAAGNAHTAARPLTELINPSSVQIKATGQSITPVVVSLPLASFDSLERYEGMLVTLTGPLTVAQNYFLGRYGQMTLAVNGRLETPTNRLRPGAAALAMADENARRSILLDDGTSTQNPNPTPFFGLDNTVRAGDTVSSITGVIDFGLATSSNAGLGSYRIQPTAPPTITRSHPRTAAPAAVGGNVRVASFNVLNYFTTLNNGSNVCPPSLTADDCRGANNTDELTRQRAKIVAAMVAMNADALALMEIENNGNTAAQHLVTALNAALGAGTYAVVPDGPQPGTDAIKVAMIYKPARLALVGTAANDTDPIHNRPPMAQTFAAPNGERFMMVVNHFKSKGCGGASGVDADQGDLQGCYNARRLDQAQALAAFIAQRQASTGVADVLVVGDLNAYAQEDPVVELTQSGFTDLVGRFNTFGYSYVFDGAAGRLDHALASVALNAKVTGTVHWHINADEPAVLDYNLEFKQPACATCGPDYYTATPYRASDHDPVLVGLSLVKRIAGTAGRDVLVGTPGDDVITGGAGADVLTGGAGRDTFVYESLRDAGDSITDFQPGTDVIDLKALLAALGIANTTAVSGGYVRWVDTAMGLSLLIDTDGAGPALARPLLTLRGVTAAQFVAARDLLL